MKQYTTKYYSFTEEELARERAKKREPHEPLDINDDVRSLYLGLALRDPNFPHPPPHKGFDIFDLLLIILLFSLIIFNG